MTLTQLDLEKLGKRGLTSKVAAVERQVRGLVSGSSGLDPFALVPERSNLLINASLEFFDRNASLPVAWNGANAVLVNTGTAFDGNAHVSLAPGGALYQKLSAGLQSSTVVTVYARTAAAGARISIDVQEAVSRGGMVVLPAGGLPQNSDDVPNNGVWYRFGRQFIIPANTVLTIVISAVGAAPIDIDAVKYEHEPGNAAFILPSRFVAEGTSSAEQVRNFAADNITTGTLIVGGDDEGAPRITVLDGDNAEVVSIGEGAGGIQIKGESGLAVVGSGSIGVLGGGSVNVLGGGSIGVHSGGNIEVKGGGSIYVEDGGAVVVGELGAQRTEVRDYGVIGYSGAGQVIFALNEAGAVGAVDVQDGDVLIGNGGTSYAFWDNSEGKLKVRGTIEGSAISGSTYSIADNSLRLNNNGVGFWAKPKGTQGTGVPISLQSAISYYRFDGAVLGSIVGEVLYAGNQPADTHLNLRLTANNISLQSKADGVFGGGLTTDQDGVWLYGPQSTAGVVNGYFAVQNGVSSWMGIGPHPGYSTAHSGLWRMNDEFGSSYDDYALLFTTTNTFLNSRGASGEILFRNNNTDRAKINSSGFEVLGRGKFSSWLEAGNATVNYSPTTANAQSGGTTLLLNGLDFTAIGFHDTGNRIDFIRTGQGTMTLGYDGGWGPANVYVPGYLSVGTPPVAGHRLHTRAAGNDASSYAFVATNLSGSNLMYLAANGYSWVNQAWTVGSDARLKEDIRRVSGSLRRLRRLLPSSYFLRADTAPDRARHFGFVAQELQRELPEVVREDNRGMLSIVYEELIPLLVDAVAELEARLETVELSAA